MLRLRPCARSTAIRPVYCAALRPPVVRLPSARPSRSFTAPSTPPSPGTPRLPDPPRSSHRLPNSAPPLPQSEAEQYAVELVAKRKAAMEAPSDSAGGIPGGTGVLFIVILLLVVLSLNYHRAEATLELSTAEHDVEISRLRIRLQQMRDLQREQMSLTLEWLEEEAPRVAAELKVPEDAARRALSAAAERVTERVNKRAALSLPLSSAASEPTKT